MVDRKEKEYAGLNIKLYGVVQGVGFRPFVAKLALKHHITGSVRNSGGSVAVAAYGAKENLTSFFAELFTKKPGQAQIVHHEAEWCEYKDIPAFTIEKSDHTADRIFIPADICICPDCLNELKDPSNPRHSHPFISCMACGPRYSIMESMPYDRETTTMRDFEMCTYCAGEYVDPKDRRYHAQTISCHACGPELHFKGHGTGDLTGKQAFKKTASHIRNSPPHTAPSVP